ncbi:hypothetical protein [Methylocella silvestris]|nr:hypothetical protein [Methylocella silvestris]
MAVAEDDVEPSERPRSKWARRALGVLLSCLAIEEAEQDLELALLALTGPERKERKVSASSAQGVQPNSRQGASAATSPMMERRDDWR